MSEPKIKNPRVMALLCFASAVLVIGVPVVAALTESWTPVWIGPFLFLGFVFLVIGVSAWRDSDS